MIIIENIIRKAQQGDETAFFTLFQRYEEEIYRMAFVYMKNQNDALDIVQETAYKSFSQIKTLKKPEYFKTWLIRITINSAISHLKKGKKVIHLKPEILEFNRSEVRDVSLELTLKDLIEKLNEEEKSVVLLKYYSNYTFSEIAEILELPLGTVKTILYRSLNKLRHQLRKEDMYGK